MTEQPTDFRFDYTKHSKRLKATMKNETKLPLGVKTVHNSSKVTQDTETIHQNNRKKTYNDYWGKDWPQIDTKSL